VSSLLLAPVRTGHKSFVEFYKKSIPCSYRVVNQVDWIGTICMEYLYDHVPYEIHCLDRVNWTYSLPDSSFCEREVKEIIVEHIKPILQPFVRGLRVETPKTNILKCRQRLSDWSTLNFLLDWKIICPIATYIAFGKFSSACEGCRFLLLLKSKMFQKRNLRFSFHTPCIVVST